MQLTWTYLNLNIYFTRERDILLQPNYSKSFYILIELVQDVIEENIEHKEGFQQIDFK